MGLVDCDKVPWRPSVPCTYGLVNDGPVHNRAATASVPEITTASRQPCYLLCGQSLWADKRFSAAIGLADKMRCSTTGGVGQTSV